MAKKIKTPKGKQRTGKKTNSGKAVKKTASGAAKKPASKKTTAASAKNKTKKKKGGSKKALMCFLTTACVNHFGLPDNCYQLNTLRKYRDSYLASTAGGRDLVLDYYRIAPAIVRNINADREQKNVFAYINDVIRLSCEHIERHEYSQAQNAYVDMVHTLRRRYSL